MQSKKLISLFILSFLAACVAPETQPLAGIEYLPVEKGKFWVYSVREERYSLTAKPVVEVYEMKEKVVDNSGKIYNIERFKRLNASAAWQYVDTHLLEVQPDGVVAMESAESTPFQKLKFPVSSGVSWTSDGSEKGQKVIVKDFQKEYVAGKTTFSPTFSVFHKNDTSLIDTDRHLEVFALNIGLVHKEKTKINYCQQADCVGKGKPDNGFRLKQTLISHGKE
jgi:hypothetical protein